MPTPLAWSALHPIIGVPCKAYFATRCDCISPFHALLKRSQYVSNREAKETLFFTGTCSAILVSLLCAFFKIGHNGSILCTFGLPPCVPVHFGCHVWSLCLFYACLVLLAQWVTVAPSVTTFSTSLYKFPFSHPCSITVSPWITLRFPLVDEKL